mmetsp:Transcript_1989/g.7612  ORF Transcript_1989/g.7612 Transcript_1989/m.7612 type:complete len:238 (-) Transcript_1989:10442-11155(-)
MTDEKVEQGALPLLVANRTPSEKHLVTEGLGGQCTEYARLHSHRRLADNLHTALQNPDREALPRDRREPEAELLVLWRVRLQGKEQAAEPGELQVAVRQIDPATPPGSLHNDDRSPRTHARRADRERAQLLLHVVRELQQRRQWVGSGGEDEHDGSGGARSGIGPLQVECRRLRQCLLPEGGTDPLPQRTHGSIGAEAAHQQRLLEQRQLCEGTGKISSERIGRFLPSLPRLGVCVE